MPVQKDARPVAGLFPRGHQNEHDHEQKLSHNNDTIDWQRVD